MSLKTMGKIMISRNKGVLFKGKYVYYSNEIIVAVSF